MFRIHMLPAQRGDALLIEYGDSDDLHRILIDGGPAKDYQKGSPEETAWNDLVHGLSAKKQELELMVLTHVDSDHIQGLIELLKEGRPPFPIHDIWFNGQRHLRPLDMLGPVEGEVLAFQIEQEHLPWNETFDGKAVACNLEKPLEPILLPGGMALTLLSPFQENLVKMREVWLKELKQAGMLKIEKAKKAALPPDMLGSECGPSELDVDEMLNPKTSRRVGNDSSKANGSSIAFLAEYEGKSCLFAADAHAKVLEAGLNALCKQRGLDVLKLDAYKVAHHGSRNNISPRVLSQLDCRRYLISTDGAKFCHPDKEALARILARTREQPGEPPLLIFNYETDCNRGTQEERLKRRYHYDTVFPADGECGQVIDLME